MYIFNLYDYNVKNGYELYENPFFFNGAKNTKWILTVQPKGR